MKKSVSFSTGGVNKKARLSTGLS